MDLWIVGTIPEHYTASQPENGDSMDLWSVGTIPQHYTASQPEDGGSMFLRNVGILPQQYKASQSRGPRLELCKSITQLRKRGIKLGGVIYGRDRAPWFRLQNCFLCLLNTRECGYLERRIDCLMFKTKWQGKDLEPHGMNGRLLYIYSYANMKRADIIPCPTCSFIPFSCWIKFSLELPLPASHWRHP